MNNQAVNLEQQGKSSQSEPTASSGNYLRLLGPINGGSGSKLKRTITW